MKGLVAAILLLLTFSCATGPDRPLVDYPLRKRILSPRPGHAPLLTYNTCVAKDSKGGCAEMALTEYDIRDKELRATLIANSFSCSIGGKLYQFCESSPSFCHQVWVKDKDNCGFLGLFCKTKPVSEVIPIERYQFLIDSGTVCAADAECDVLGNDC